MHLAAYNSRTYRGGILEGAAGSTPVKHAFAAAALMVWLCGGVAGAQVSEGASAQQGVLQSWLVPVHRSDAQLMSKTMQELDVQAGGLMVQVPSVGKHGSLAEGAMQQARQA